MVRVFTVFAVLFSSIFTLIWLASFTGYFDKARVKRIRRVGLVASATIFFTVAAVGLIFGLEHTIF